MFLYLTIILKEANLKFRIIGILIVPTIVLANVVWPALYLEIRLFSWWAISFGLLIELFFIKKLFNLSLKDTVKPVVVANIISAILGIILIPLGGIIWEIFPGLIFYHFFELGTFNPATWFGTFLLASLINAVVESLIYQKIFKIKLSFKSKTFISIFLVNMLSVSLAFISIFIYPIRM